MSLRAASNICASTLGPVKLVDQHAHAYRCMISLKYVAAFVWKCVTQVQALASIGLQVICSAN